MSDTPGINPITTDIEDVRHLDEDGFLGDEGYQDVDTDETDGEPLGTPMRRLDFVRAADPANSR